jgi:hypothetical protein
MTHDFKERLNYSLESSDEPFWEAVYKKAFPSFTKIMTVNDLAKQKLGIDRVLYFGNGKEIYIDEKKREKVWPDILLEYISVDRNNTPGWIEKDLVMDYLAYAFMPTQRVYLFPWDMLRRAWLHYKEDWLKKYKIIEAKNNTYSTWSVAVPINVLKNAVGLAMIIQLKD